MVIIWSSNIKEVTGTVVSTKMDKTIVVKVDRVKMQPLYKKRFTVNKNYYAHDEDNTAKEGDVVRIRACRPYSKQKRWMLIDIVAQEVSV